LLNDLVPLHGDFSIPQLPHQAHEARVGELVADIALLDDPLALRFGRLNRRKQVGGSLGESVAGEGIRKRGVGAERRRERTRFGDAVVGGGSGVERSGGRSRFLSEESFFPVCSRESDELERKGEKEGRRHTLSSLQDLPLTPPLLQSRRRRKGHPSRPLHHRRRKPLSIQPLLLKRYPYHSMLLLLLLLLLNRRSRRRSDLRSGMGLKLASPVVLLRWSSAESAGEELLFLCGVSGGLLLLVLLKRCRPRWGSRRRTGVGTGGRGKGAAERSEVEGLLVLRGRSGLEELLSGGVVRKLGGR
jgi:hypothetical protein